MAARPGGRQFQQAVKEGQLGDEVGTEQCGRSGGVKDQGKNQSHLG